MFLEWILQSNLLEHREDTYILKNFPPEMHKVLCRSFVTFLNEGRNAAKLLTTASHVRWAMEIIGLSFGLPMDSIDIIQSAFNLYESWCSRDGDNMHENRPTALLEDEQTFLQAMIGHMSILFQDRRAEGEVLRSHVDIR